MVEFQFWHWIVFAFILLAVELFAPSFVALCLGLSALLVSLVKLALPAASFPIQIFLWTICSIAFVTAFFKLFKPRMKNRTLAGVAREAVIGETGRVIRLPTEAQPGMMRFTIPLLGNDEWLFVCEKQVELGDNVKITEVSGNTLIVKKTLL